jgi:hypothetical protein
VGFGVRSWEIIWRRARVQAITASWISCSLFLLSSRTMRQAVYGSVAVILLDLRH